MQTIFQSIALATVLGLTMAPSGAQDYAAWADVNQDGSWTSTAEEAVKATKLPHLVPGDVAAFCPRYDALNADERTQFWVALLSAMAKLESNFKPETKYVEKKIFDAQGRNVISRGLLQISIESANQKRYACGIKEALDLHRVDVNLQCAARIMHSWVAADKRIATLNGENRGGARYWSVLRPSKGRDKQIMAFTKKLEVCKP